MNVSASSTAALMMLLAFAPGIGDAAVVTWDGGGTNANWATAGNWNGDVVPGSADDVVFGSAFTSGLGIALGANRTINSMWIASAAAFSLSGNTLTLSSGNLTRSATSSGAQTISSNITLGANGIWTIAGGGNLTVSGAIDDGNKTRSITKDGDGTLILSGANGYDGGTVVNAGTVVISGNLNRPGGGATLNGGTLFLDYADYKSDKLTGALFFAGGDLVLRGGTGSTYYDSVSSTTVRAGESMMSRMSGVAVMRLNSITRDVGGTLDYAEAGIADTDTTNTNGILGGWATVAGTDWARNSGGSNGLISAYTGYTASFAATSNNVSLTGNVIQAGVTINSLRLTATSGTQTLTVSSGTLILTSGGLLATGAGTKSISGGSLAGAAGRDLIVIQNGSGALAIGAVITNNGSATALTKSGSGKLVLSGANTYSGSTFVNSGTLVVNGNQNSATGSVSISSGAMLKGSGTVGGSTTFAGKATHAPGDGIGSQNFRGSITYGAGSFFEWEMNYAAGNQGTRGANYDAVNAGGGVSGGNAVFEIVLPGSTGFSDAFWNVSRSWTDIFTRLDGAAAITNWTNTFSSLAFYNLSGGSKTAISAPSSAEGSFTLSGNSLTWTSNWSAVPEPTSALAGLLLAAGLLRRRRCE